LIFNRKADFLQTWGRKRGQRGSGEGRGAFLKGLEFFQKSIKIGLNLIGKSSGGKE
jgi:hypothetical protein